MEELRVSDVLKNVELQQVRVTVGRRGMLGSGTKLLGCDVVLQGQAQIVDADLDSCRIFGRNLKETLWDGAALTNCVLMGAFIGNRFYGDEAHTTLSRCDLSLARFDGCDFVPGTLTGSDNLIPAWPSFLMVNPYQNGEKLAQASLGTGLEGWVRALKAGHQIDREVLFDASALCERKGVDGPTLMGVLKKCVGFVSVSGSPPYSIS